MRIKNSIYNSLTGVATQIVTIILNFVSRTVFIYALGNEYLGINGLFSNILSLLSLSELGIGTAITFSLYKAVAEENQYKINALMTLYRRIYRIISIGILIIGLSISPFLQYLINGSNFSNNYIKLIFIINIINSSASYLLSYRTAIIFVNQKDYILKMISMIFNSIAIIMQITILILFKNYVFYLITQVIFTVINNTIGYYLSRKMYPEVKYSKYYKLNKLELKEIIIKVKSLIVHSISSFITFGTDNIVISYFIGIIEVGIYSNYNLIISTVNTLLNRIIEGVTSSMGNLIATSNRDKVYDIFNKMYFICFWIFSFSFVCLFNIINPFICVWLGEKNILSTGVVIVLLMNFYIIGVRQAVIITRNAGGFYTNDRLAAIVKPIANITITIVLTKEYGLIGVFLGTLISSIIADILLSPYFLYKKYFNKSYIEYIKKYFVYLCITISNILITYIICGMLPSNLNIILSILVKLIICIITTNITIWIMFKNKEEFIFIFRIINNLCSKNDKVLVAK